MNEDEPAHYRCHSARDAWRWIALACALAIALLAARSGAALGYALGAVVAFGFLLLKLPIRIDVEVGREGVTFRSVGRRKLVPYDAIESVEVRETEGTGNRDGENGPTRSWTVYLSVVFKLKNGGEIEVGTGEDEISAAGNHMTGRVGSFGATDAVSRALVRDVRNRMRALREHEPSPLEQELARGDRSVAEWLESLARLAAPQTDAYRASSLDKEALWAILESPAAAPSARAGAAVVLRKLLDEDDAPRVRVALERCERSELRVAIEHALEEDSSEELETAIARVE